MLCQPEEEFLAKSNKRNKHIWLTQWGPGCQKITKIRGNGTKILIKIILSAEIVNIHPLNLTIRCLNDFNDALDSIKSYRVHRFWVIWWPSNRLFLFGSYIFTQIKHTLTLIYLVKKQCLQHWIKLSCANYIFSYSISDSMSAIA